MDNLPIVHWPYLLTALVLLWFPRHWMRVGKLGSKRRRQRETMERFAQEGGNDPDDKSVKLKRELKSGRNYIDLFRGFAGSFCLWHFSFVITLEQRDLFNALCGLICLIGVVLQTTRFRERVTFFAAIFFLAGMSMGIGNIRIGDEPGILGNYYAAGIAFLLVCAINPVIATPRLFVVAYGLLLLPFGWLLGGGFQLAWINALLVLLPALFSVMAKRPMVIFTRRRQTW